VPAVATAVAATPVASMVRLIGSIAGVYPVLGIAAACRSKRQNAEARNFPQGL
jgi:hypothetical protein